MLKDKYVLKRTVDMDQKIVEELYLAVADLFDMLGYNLILMRNSDAFSNKIELELSLTKKEDQDDKT